MRHNPRIPPTSTLPFIPAVLTPGDVEASDSANRHRTLVAALAAKMAPRELLQIARSMRKEATDESASGDYPYLVARDVLDAIDAHFGGGDRYLQQLIVALWTRLMLE